MRLPAPHPHQSIVSDGRVVPRALKRSSCLQCGAASHACSLAETDVRAIYGGDYRLAEAAPNSDLARARAYAQWFRGEDLAPRSVLEVGCGSGALLLELSKMWPDAECTGIDPALPVTDRSDHRLRLRRGFIEDMPNDSGDFDLILCINVIEHMADPGTFLARLQSRLAPNGKIAVVCPATQPPNLELLFYDHQHSFTPYALASAIEATSLVARKYAAAPTTVGDFQMIVFDTGKPVTAPPSRSQLFSELWSQRRSYLECWSNLDRVLLSRSDTNSPIVAFGGGQTAALLRAYTPRTWQRVEMIVLDEVGEAWNLDKPVASYAYAVQNLGEAQILIATSPHVQKAIAERLKSDGLRSTRWDDLVAM